MSKSIAKNASLLYIRMAFVMLITLYTSRVIINTLGVEDYGIYGIIHGIVAMFAFMSSSLSSAIQRFLNISIGENRSKEYINHIFSQCFWIIIVVILAIAFFGETFGLWMVTSNLEIPVDRLDSTIILYHCTLIILLLHTIQIPFIGAIMARERFSFYAWISILDISLKLLIVYLLRSCKNVDQLEMYGYLLLFVTLNMTLAYVFYCVRKISECRVVFIWNRSITNKLFSFIGFNIVGSILNISTMQGLNLICNLYFGPIVNAAISIMFQVKSAIFRIAEGVFSAVKPQLIQSYAQNKILHMYDLVCKSSKYAYVLILTICIPFFLDTEYILSLWLDTVPDHTANITRVIIVDVLITALCYPITLIAIARGEIKKVEVFGRLITLLSLPFILIYLFTGNRSITIIVSIYTFSTLCYYFYCVFECLKQINVSLLSYIRSTTIPILIITLNSAVFATIIMNVLQCSFLRLVLLIISVLITNIIGILFTSNKNERQQLYKLVNRFLKF